MSPASNCLSGPSVCGFYGAFESDYGDDSTPRPYARVTPTRVGSALLPFNCPSCDSKIDFSDAKRRESYHDTRVLGTVKKDNYWCPNCDARFVLNKKGITLNGPVSNDVAPSVVENVVLGDDGLVSITRKNNSAKKNLVVRLHKEYVLGSDLIGCS
jgi:hypothetical protein